MAHNKFNNDKVERAVRKRDRNETTENVGSGLKCNRQQSVDKMAYLKVMSLLYIAMQHRESDMRKFFCYENQPFPPSLSDHQGKLHFVKKSDLPEVSVHNIHSEPPDTIFTLDSLMKLLWYTYYPLSMLRRLMNTLIKSFSHTYQNNYTS